jgi:hypothetical protein
MIQFSNSTPVSRQSMTGCDKSTRRAKAQRVHQA